jgi:hypothetical protein
MNLVNGNFYVFQDLGPHPANRSTCLTSWETTSCYIMTISYCSRSHILKCCNLSLFLLVNKLVHSLASVCNDQCCHISFTILIGFPPLRSGVRDRVVMWDFVVDKVAPGQVSSEYFGFPYQIHSTNCSKKSSSSLSSSSSINHRGYVQ